MIAATDQTAYSVIGAPVWSADALANEVWTATGIGKPAAVTKRKR